MVRLVCSTPWWPALALGLGVAGPGRAADTGYVDLHVHAGCIGAGDSGCFVAPQLRRSYKFDWYLEAFDTSAEEIAREGDVVVLRKLSARVAASREVSRAVVLALDGVVGPDGELDKARTQLYVPTEYLARTLPAFDNLLLGASVNPYRRDAIARLETAKRAGAVLIKWIPPIMDIDPADPALAPFYDALARLGLPLLTHTGRESAFDTARDELGDPARLALALERGVTVIAAHLAATGSVDGQDNFERLLPMFARYPNLYADISSLTQLNKLGYLERALDRPGVVARLLYGSDWPLQFFPLVSPWYQVGTVELRELWRIRGIGNVFDRDVALKRAMGVPEAVFRRAETVLGLGPGPRPPP